MRKRFTTMLAFQGQNPLGIDVYKKYITINHIHVIKTGIDKYNKNLGKT